MQANKIRSYARAFGQIAEATKTLRDFNPDELKNLKPNGTNRSELMLTSRGLQSTWENARALSTVRNELTPALDFVDRLGDHSPQLEKTIRNFDTAFTERSRPFEDQIRARRADHSSFDDPYDKKSPSRRLMNELNMASSGRTVEPSRGRRLFSLFGSNLAKVDLEEQNVLSKAVGWLDTNSKKADQQIRSFEDAQARFLNIFSALSKTEKLQWLEQRMSIAAKLVDHHIEQTIGTQITASHWALSAPENYDKALGPKPDHWHLDHIRRFENSTENLKSAVRIFKFYEGIRTAVNNESDDETIRQLFFPKTTGELRRLDYREVPALDLGIPRQAQELLDFNFADFRNSLGIDEFLTSVVSEAA